MSRHIETRQFSPRANSAKDIGDPQILVRDGRIIEPAFTKLQPLVDQRLGINDSQPRRAFVPGTATVNRAETTRRVRREVIAIAHEVNSGEWIEAHNNASQMTAIQRERMWYALEHNRFQPIFQTQHVVWDNGKPHRNWGEDPPDAELLTRLIEPNGVYMPGDFIDYIMSPEAQHEGLTRAFTLQCIGIAEQCAQDSGHSISVNIHPELFKDRGFVQALRQDDSLATHVVLEILETAPLSNNPFVSKAIADLNRCGVRFAIDDFDPYASEAEGNFSALNLARYTEITGDSPYEIKLGHQVLVGASALTDSELRAHLAFAMDSAIGSGAQVLTIEAVNDGKQERMILEHLRSARPVTQCRIQSRSLYGNKAKHGLTADELSQVPPFQGSK